MNAIRRIVGAAYGMHVADQIALLCVPLIADLVFDAGPAALGLLVACQSLAQILGSLPFGLLVDHYQSRRLAVASTLLSVFGFLGAWWSVLTVNLVAFGVSITIAGFGIVLFVLVVLSLIPTIVDGQMVATANAKVEIPRSIASFLVPLLVGIMITATNSRWILAAAVAGAAVAAVFAARFPDIAPTGTETISVVSRLREGWRFVLSEVHLRAITLCALAWNFGFAVLLVAMLPFLEAVDLEPGVFGLALAFFGAAAVVGSWLAGALATRIPPGVVLVLGPAASIAAAGIVFAATVLGAAATIYAGFFLLGLGPSMWLVAQNTVRQLVTPRDMLGRVNSVIQTAIYGVRPIGALAGGVIVGSTNPNVGLMCVIGAFVLSSLAAAGSRLRTVTDYAALASVGSG